MPKKTIIWEWQEAFYKFGFGDGDSWNGTYIIENFLEDKGWEVHADSWGIHNYMIFSIKKEDEEYKFDGYEEPEDILPEELARDLNKTFHENYGVSDE